MKIELVSMSKLPVARRKLRQSGIRLTVRYGQVYTIRAVKINQPNSDAQLAMRNIMAQASALAKKELANEERKSYWAARAAELGYKTARGACIAHHISRLRTAAEAAKTTTVQTTSATLAVCAKTTCTHHPHPITRITPANTAKPAIARRI